MEKKDFKKTNMAGNISLKRINKQNLPFFIGWIGVLVWLDFCVLPMGRFPVSVQLLSISAHDAFSVIYLITAVVIICFFMGNDYIKLLPISGIICVVGIIFSLIFPESGFVPYIIVICAVAFGHLFASFGYSFFMLLNNSEKFYAMLFAVIISKMMIFIRPIMQSLCDSIFAVLIIILIAICCLITRNRYTDSGFNMNKKLSASYYSVMILVFVAYVLNDVVAPAMLKSIITETMSNIEVVYFVGILLGALLTYLLRKVIQINICHSINVSFMCLGLGSFFAVLNDRNNIFIYITALLFGIAFAMGFITIYYMCGIMAKRFQSVRFYRIGVVVSGIAYVFGFALTKHFPFAINNTAFIAAATVTIVLSMFIFAVSPLFVKTLYSAEWTDDLYRPDVTYGNRLDEKFKALALSPRESELCKLLLDGYTLRQVAATLQIAYPTANTYQTCLYRKLSINSKTELLLLFKEHITK